MKPKEPTRPAEPTHARPGSRDLMPWTIEQILSCVEFERDSKVNTILGLLVDQFGRERIDVRGPFWPLLLPPSLSPLKPFVVQPFFSSVLSWHPRERDSSTRKGEETLTETLKGKTHLRHRICEVMRSDRHVLRCNESVPEQFKETVNSE